MVNYLLLLAFYIKYIVTECHMLILVVHVKVVFDKGSCIGTTTGQQAKTISVETENRQSIEEQCIYCMALLSVANNYIYIYMLYTNTSSLYMLY